jgi:hypothetical protein
MMEEHRFLIHPDQTLKLAADEGFEQWTGVGRSSDKMIVDSRVDKKKLWMLGKALVDIDEPGGYLVDEIDRPQACKIAAYRGRGNPTVMSARLDVPRAPARVATKCSIFPIIASFPISEIARTSRATVVVT